MAAKHDGKKARANHWVMQQNLAKQKGGRPGYQFTEKKPAKPAKKSVAAEGAKRADGESASASDEVTSARQPTEPTEPTGD